MAEADLEVGGVVRIDAVGDEDVAESFDGVHLAGTGVAGIDAGREEAIRHGTVTCPTLATGRSSAAVGGREVGRSVQGLGRCHVDGNVHDSVERPPRPLRNAGV